MRLKVVSVLAVFMVMLAGSAWAGETEVVGNINAYGAGGSSTLGASGNGSGTITVTGIKTDATTILNLGDISGLTIEWNATLTGDFNDFPPIVDPEFPDWKHIGLIAVWGDGTFNINAGAKIQISGTENNILQHVYLIRVEDPYGPATINVNGGTLEALMPHATAIDRDSYVPPVININGGTINVPHGTVAVGDVTVGAGADVTGTVIKQPSGQRWDDDWSDWDIYLYGDCSMEAAFEDPDANEEAIDIHWHIMPGATATVREGATWSIRKGFAESWILEIEKGGTLEIYGTVYNFDYLINNGTINNYSGNTLYNEGDLTNNGTIFNAATGRIRNTGTIDNKNGTITNEGVFQSVQTAEEMGGTVDGSNPIEKIDTSSGGGCNAGFGLFGLLPLAVWAARKRMTA